MQAMGNRWDTFVYLSPVVKACVAGRQQGVLLVVHLFAKCRTTIKTGPRQKQEAQGLHVSKERRGTDKR